MSSATVPPADNGPAPESVRVGHDRDGVSPSLAVVEAIADLVGVEPAALADEAGIVLYEHVDPDALDSLVSGRPPADVDLSFSIDDYRVSVGGHDVVVRRSIE